MLQRRQFPSVVDSTGPWPRSPAQRCSNRGSGRLRAAVPREPEWRREDRAPDSGAADETDIKYSKACNTPPLGSISVVRKRSGPKAQRSGQRREIRGKPWGRTCEAGRAWPREQSWCCSSRRWSPPCCPRPPRPDPRPPRPGARPQPEARPHPEVQSPPQRRHRPRSSRPVSPRGTAPRTPRGTAPSRRSSARRRPRRPRARARRRSSKSSRRSLPAGRSSAARGGFRFLTACSCHDRETLHRAEHPMRPCPVPNVRRTSTHHPCCRCSSSRGRALAIPG